MPTLELQNVSYSYEKGKPVLSNISIALEAGKLYAVLGPSDRARQRCCPFLGDLIHQPRAKSCLTARTLRQKDWNITAETAFR